MAPGVAVPSAPPPPVEVALVGEPVLYVWRPPAEPTAARAYYGSWSSGLCACCADPLYACAFLWCFPCAALLRVQSIIEKVGSLSLPIVGVVDKSNALFYGLIAAALALVTCWFSVGLPYVIFLFLIYKGVQARFAIKESDWKILFKVWCCSCCSLLQLGRHVDGYDEALQAERALP